MPRLAVVLAALALASCDAAEPVRPAPDPILGHWVASGPDRPLPPGEAYVSALLTLGARDGDRVSGLGDLALGTCEGTLCSPACRGMGTLVGTPEALAFGPDVAVFPEDAGVRFTVEVLERTDDAMTARVSAASGACPAPTTVTLYKMPVR